VDSAGVLKNLLEKRLVKVIGRKEVVGRPLLYGTTREFLLQFGLSSLSELPSVEEFAALVEADMGEQLTVESAQEGTTGTEGEPGAQAPDSKQPEAAEGDPAQRSPEDADSGGSP
jgi:segregation and condensation protein B